MSVNDFEQPDESQAPPVEEFEEGGDEEVIDERRPKFNSNTLLLLGLCAAVGLGTYLMCMRASAQTTPVDPAVTLAATKISLFLKGGEEEKYRLNAIQRDTEKIVDQFSHPKVHQVPLNELKANPFRDLDDDKPVAPTEDQQQLQDELRQKQAEALAKTLKLQSIVYSSHSICMINGRPYSVGQGSEAFIVESIEQNGVWVRVGTLKVQLLMNAPHVD
jgi:hypothetical protein